MLIIISTHNVKIIEITIPSTIKIIKLSLFNHSLLLHITYKAWSNAKNLITIMVKNITNAIN